jgi:flagellar hook-associated protein 3 FlgL
MQVNPNYNSTLSAAISTSSAREQQLVSELSSGLRVSDLSADPVAVGANVQLEGVLSQLDSFVQGASGNQSLLQVSDSTLGEVVGQLTAAVSLATQGANGTLTPANLSSLAQKASAIRDSVLSLANTSYQGSYLFSGSAGQTPPFTLTSTTTPATITYAGDGVTRYTQTPTGQKLALNVPGSAIFTASGASVLGTLNQLVSDLVSGSSAGVAADSSALTTALAAFSTQRAVLGSSLSQLNATSSYAQTEATLLAVQQTKLLSADTAAVATELKTAEVQHQALISVVSGLSQNNLFSYIK